MIYENSFLVFRPMSLLVLLGRGVTGELCEIEVVDICETERNLLNLPASSI